MSQNKPLVYGDYLQLDKLLDAQVLQSENAGRLAHHEMFFIIIHQSNELWFKQILYELEFILNKMSQASENELPFPSILNAFERIVEIQILLNNHIDVLETLRPQDFLSFRDLLTPASGFQSVQYRLIEVTLGLYDDKSLPELNFFKYFNSDEKESLLKAHAKPSLFSKLQEWLRGYEQEAISFLTNYYAQIKAKLLKQEDNLKNNKKNYLNDIQLEQLQDLLNSIESLLNEKSYEKKHERLSYTSFLSALFLTVKQDKEDFQLASQILKHIIEIDELMATWRYRHVLMVQRMIGTKVGTGGTKGYTYLKDTVEKNRIFSGFAKLSSYLIKDLFLDY